MTLSRKNLALLALIASAAAGRGAIAQVGVPEQAASAGRDTTTHMAPVSLQADLSKRMIFVKRGGETIKTYQVAVGQERYPTPTGTFSIRKIVWNPSWHPPPGSAWAKGKTPKGPGEPGNPMKVVKMFFKEPDYYIHGTGDVGSLGEAESHGCLRMDPEEVADLAKLVMTEGGEPREENWFWRLIHFRREQKVVYLDQPVSLTITD
ncbi:MAG TPA: L,D-transpeptidase [Gemmatimonadaceae bacterium]|nr:L,D-transpeptidase [Gemmatimonadaceae bacterium]